MKKSGIFDVCANTSAAIVFSTLSMSRWVSLASEPTPVGKNSGNATVVSRNMRKIVSFPPCKAT